MNMLELDEFNILEVWGDDQYRKFVVEAKDAPILCTQCGSITGLDGTFDGKKFKLHDVRTRTVKDVDIRGKKVVIEIRQRRYRCPECNEIFTEFFESVARDDKVTVRLREHMGVESVKAKNTFKSVSEQYGVSEMTVKRAFDIYVDGLYRERVLVAPRVLGIDEVYLNLDEKAKDNDKEKTDEKDTKKKKKKRKIPCAVFTDIEKGEIIEFIKGNTKEIVLDVIKSMQGYENIQMVTMDMNSTYRNVVKELIPKAYCVVDHFHVIQKANMRLNEMRASIQHGLAKGEKVLLYAVKNLITSNRDDLNQEALDLLDAELSKYPHLKQAYVIKEGLIDVYKCQTQYDAYQRYYQWECSIPKEAKEMKSLQKLINRLKKEVFAFFDGRLTNAFTESFNNVIKRIVRLGVGYSYEILRAKVLFGTKATEVTDIKDAKLVRLQDLTLRDSCEGILVYSNEKMVDGVPVYPSYRVNVDVLLEVLESGEFV